ncbi:CoA transferase [Lysinibacter sp. HNR]|uniref:CaiB/BaiF CoA transferase family protein n=1 Tax=Lysinibacter sp. HNR TaxID=3031408 RepID=UPI00243498E4|nr:CoA transferase [Lysinibacter sp. HNR]WGD36950.1 CoA transferase [Lysinibacter sp. HNR]
MNTAHNNKRERPEETPQNPLDQPRGGPLSGLIIADFTRVLAGPYCTMLLGDMGATVIKVESPAGDDTRGYAPPYLNEDATYYLSSNRNKHSVVLNLKNEQDREVALQLAAVSDVLIENFKVGGMASFGLDYDAVAAVNPEIIYTSITGFGTGEGAQYPGYDLSAQAFSGMMSITGEKDGGPLRAGFALFDVITGLHAGMGILGALHHRTLTGEGQLLELNLLSSALSGMVYQTSAYVAGGEVPTRLGNEHPSLYPYEPFPTTDGSLVVAVGNDTQFARLCVLLGLPELASDTRFSTMAARNQHREELRRTLLPRFGLDTSEHWFDELTREKIPCAPVNTIAQGVTTAERFGLDPVVFAGEGERRIPTVRHPVSYSATPASYDLAPPVLGSSTQLVRDWLTKHNPHSEEI